MKPFIILTSVIVVICALFYCVMIIDTNRIMLDAKMVFIGKTQETYTQGKPIDRYNICNNYTNISRISKLKLSRIFTIHNFADGYIWVKYSCEYKDINGKIVYGANNVISKWKIHKSNGKWGITDIIEEP